MPYSTQLHSCKDHLHPPPVAAGTVAYNNLPC